MADEPVEMVPSRNFWERYAPVRILPPNVSRLYNAVKKQFGQVLASIVLGVYYEYGSATASYIAVNMLKMETPENVYKFLIKNANLLGNGSKIVSKIVFSLMYSSSLEKVRELARKYEKQCPKVTERATSILFVMTKYGVIPSYKCIVNIALHELCNQSIKRNCTTLYDMYLKYKEVEKKNDES